MIFSDNIEKPLIHQQCDGKTNNITFKTQHIDLWKQTILSYFENATPQNDGSTIKITCKSGETPDQTLNIKVNFYKSGMVVIQGSKCSVFESNYFNLLKELVHQKAKEPEMDLTNPPPDLEETVPKTVDDIDPEITILQKPQSAKQNHVITSTPVNHNSKKIEPSPRLKEHIAERQELLTSKLTSIYTALDTVDSTLQTIANLVTDVKSVATKVGNDNNRLCKNNYQISDQIQQLESKIKHSSSTIESLHVKSNTVDSQIKHLSENQETIQKKLDKILSYLERLDDKNEETTKKLKT